MFSRIRDCLPYDDRMIVLRVHIETAILWSMFIGLIVGGTLGGALAFVGSVTGRSVSGFSTAQSMFFGIALTCLVSVLVPSCVKIRTGRHVCYSVVLSVVVVLVAWGGWISGCRRGIGIGFWLFCGPLCSRFADYRLNGLECFS